ncbi:MAG TPA: helix-turn-helix transcriptional regulator [Trebonia sp.]|jgi:hypothetical protein|nr:helix-turn-helix transcriptional regulator [Trebonia sp.]
MATGQGPVVQSAILRRTLAQLRRDKALTQEDVAEGLEWPPSKLIRIEGGLSGITKTDLDALISHYGLESAAERDRLQQLNREARERVWWDVYRHQISPEYLNYVGYEAGASFIRQFPGTVIPGLVQTADYAEALTRISVNDEEKITEIVDLRMQRQSELARRSNRPRQYYVLDEAVIRRHVGIETNPAIMPGQLRSIADRAANDELVTVRVIPFPKGAHAGLSGPFTVLEFDGLPDLLYLDAGRGPLVMVIGDDTRVADYRDNFELLLQQALREDESIEFIQSAAEEMSNE